MNQPSSDIKAGRNVHSGPPLPPGSFAGFLIAITAVVLIAFFSYQSLDMRAQTSMQVTRTIESLDQIKMLLSIVKDGETSQRGYLLTGDERYLEPYTRASAKWPGEIRQLRERLGGDSSALQALDVLDTLAAEKTAELERTVALQRAGDHAAALAIVNTDHGKALMDEIRALVAQLEGKQRQALADREQEWKDAVGFSTAVTLGGSGALLLLIIAAAVMTSRDYRARERYSWVRAGQGGLSARMQGEQRLETLGDNVLEFLAQFMGAHAGAIYLAEGDGRYRRFSGYALAPDAGDTVIRPGDGLLGQAVKERRAVRVSDVPEGYLDVASALGRSKARELLIAPAIVDGIVHAVIELGFLRPIHPADEELFERVSEAMAIAVRSSKDRTRLEELLEETQRQAEELQAQQEELRVSNEELEEQGRVLKESQAQLESQQAELEQTNSHLEEQTQLLEHQKDELARAQQVLGEKAEELERSNQYKSEFLANMSHELRTPLNSTLILAKLLADNKDGNLNEQQIKFAQTIASAGNDLLTLINDILDLSKIEAGQVEVAPESLLLTGTIEGMVRSVEPIAQQKSLKLALNFEPGVPERIETDPQRFGQILRNLLSNALKFTEHGEVALRVFGGGDGTVSFSVRDTGIGIPESQLEIIFEAFRQADGSTHRRYGGTGLGLSISRDLARLLGGDIAVHSTPGEGSVFTLTLPAVYAGRNETVHPPHAPSPPVTKPPREAPPPQPRAGTAPAAAAVDDDRGRLDADARTILVIEDDVRFAAILRDLAHELGFQCVVTHTAGDGLAAAAMYRPSAIVLDMNLPDHSGLGVLDQLKHNPQTRHIPVHVASVADYTHEALERGAIGYALKPVKREQLVNAFRRLEAKFTQSLRRVLVVEDDERQRDSICELLISDDVQIVAVASASEALAQLRATTFDCMVMDLNLPDFSGYELLDRMSEQGDVAFPPIIVYTGRSLGADEEQRLRRHSKSIIIKDARSPERLLDEVTLFLHQVEAELPIERQRMLKAARDRDDMLSGRRVLVVEDDVRNIFALTSVLEPKGVKIEIARNGLEALAALDKSRAGKDAAIDLVLMDIMMPEMDGLTAMREIRKRSEWKKLPIIALTAKAMQDDQERCRAAGASDYIAKPLDVEKLLSLVRVWMPK